MAEIAEYIFNSNAEWRDRGFSLRSPPVCIVTYDPAGDGKDNDALVVLLREEHQKGEPYDPDFAVENKYRVLMCERMPSHYEFPDKLARLLSMHRRLLSWTAEGKIFAHVFAVETNGVGWGLSSALKAKVGSHVIPYTTVSTTGDRSYTGMKVSMPRLAALDHMRIMMETFHLRISPDAVGAKDLLAEMNSFVWRAPGRPEAIQGQHDDLVMATCGGLWIGSRVIQPVLKAEAVRGRIN